MRRTLRKLMLFFLSLLLVFCLFPDLALAAPESKVIIGNPMPPQNQAANNALLADLFETPTSTATSSTAGYFIDSYVNNHAAAEQGLRATAASYLRKYEISGSMKNFNHMIKNENAASIHGFKSLGAEAAGKFYGGYCLYKDVTEYNNPSKHKHSSLAFLDQSLRGFNIVSSALDNGGMKLAKPLAIGGGILKDAVGGNTVSDWANKQDNVLLDFADWVTDGVNNTTYETMLYWMNVFNHTDNANVFGRPPYGAGVYKPNIYLYPDENTRIAVTFDLPGLLTAAIPRYARRWQVIAAPDGSLIDTADDTAYEYLFYESQTDPALFTYDSGWIICAATREAQFREILAAYGFNETEISDFVSFWGTKLAPGTDYAMYPQLTAAIDGAMPITVFPVPVNTFRLWFAFAADYGQNPASPVVTAMNRQGYTLVEWGGFFID